MERQHRPAADIGRAPWEMSISEEQWNVYRCVLVEAGKIGQDFALGGAFALATHTGCLRNTKDLDIYVLPGERQRMVEVLTRCGLEDYYSRLPYDRGWIYRGACDDAIVDVIWGMPNRRAEVDEQWLARGPRLQIRGSVLSMLPAEELIWCKLYVMQRQRCDWPDVLNLLYFTAEKLDWSQAMRLEFEPPDLDRFPALRLGLEVAKAGGTAGAVMNAANEMAVAAFLAGELSFREIVPLVQSVLENHHFDPSPTLDQLLAADRWARQEASRWVCA